MTAGTVTLGLIGIAVALLTIFYYYTSRKYKFWKQQGVAYIKPLPFIGSLKDVVFQKFSIGNYFRKVYEEHKGEPYVGIYSFDEPAAVIRDLDLAKKILVKDSNYFSDHIFNMDKGLDPLGARLLFVMKGQKWKQMRNYLSPTFTSGKMKNMFHLVEQCAKELDNYLDSVTTYGTPIEVKNVMSKYTMAAIASCAFGLESNTIKDPESEFSRHLNNAFQFDIMRAFTTHIVVFAPKFLKYLRMNLFDPALYDFVRRTVWTTISYREENGINRRDFLDSLSELKRKVTASKVHDSFSNLEDDDYAAQALSFLTAGFETSSTTIGFTLYELALQPEIQDKLRAEINEVLQKHNNEVTYEAIQEMKYLDMVVNETLRKYPVLPFLDRVSVMDYEFPAPSGKGTVKIPAGTGVFVPLLGLQYDPEYFPDPEKYDPERFSEEGKQGIPAYSYMPFGEGPRICIGMRFGLMQTKTGLIHVFSRYEVNTCKETQIPLRMDVKNFLVASEEGIKLSFNKVK